MIYGRLTFSFKVGVTFFNQPPRRNISFSSDFKRSTRSFPFFILYWTSRFQLFGKIFQLNHSYPHNYDPILQNKHIVQHKTCFVQLDHLAVSALLPFFPTFWITYTQPHSVARWRIRTSGCRSALTSRGSPLHDDSCNKHTNWKMNLSRINVVTTSATAILKIG